MAAPVTLSFTVPTWIAPLVLAVGDITSQWLYTSAVIICALLVCYLLWHPAVPAVHVPVEADELPEALLTQTVNVPDPMPPAHMPCRNPATGDYLGSEAAESAAGVSARVQRARAAQDEWAKTSFTTRRQLMRILSRCVLDHAEIICRISARDSGKTTTDAAFGEVCATVLHTCVRLAPTTSPPGHFPVPAPSPRHSALGDPPLHAAPGTSPAPRLRPACTRRCL